mgnify:CR=1 FL=1
MKNKKFSRNNKNKRVNTIIEIRKEVLEMIRSIGDTIDLDLHTEKNQKIIKKELREIAEMVRDKDRLIERLEELKVNKKKIKEDEKSLTNQIKAQVIIMLHARRKNIIATQYDEEELAIIDLELNEIERMVREKERLIKRKNQDGQGKSNGRINPHMSRYFKMDCGPNIE